MLILASSYYMGVRDENCLDMLVCSGALYVGGRKLIG